MSTHNGSGNDPDARLARIERALSRCLEWSRAGRHLKIIAEVDRALPRLRRQPRLEAQLLIWKAQAHLALGDADEARPAASRSWHLDPTPHACHLLSNALAGCGEPDGAEDLLESGCDLFPDAYHLPVQLAILLADQGRHEEALDTIDRLPDGAPVPDDLQVFLLGLHANLLAAVGRWGEADGVLRNGRFRHPDSDVLEDAHRSLGEAWARFRAQERLAESWLDGLDDVDDVAAEVDTALSRLGDLVELPHLVVIAARRLWRAYIEEQPPKLHAPDPWAAALLIAVLELDGDRPTITDFARRCRCSASTTRSALRRVRRFLSGLDRNLARRAFAATNNPRLVDHPVARPAAGTASVIPFPTQ